MAANIGRDPQTRSGGILIACVDGLKCFPEGTTAVYPRGEVQLCILHMVQVRWLVKNDIV